MDPQTERYVGDGAGEANAFLSRSTVPVCCAQGSVNPFEYRRTRDSRTVKSRYDTFSHLRIAVPSLRRGGLALGGVSLSQVLQLKSATAAEPKRPGKSVIMICLGGGPATSTRAHEAGISGGIPWRIPADQVQRRSMDLCELLPGQAKIADKFSVVRSVKWQEAEHQRIEIFTGFQSVNDSVIWVYVSRLARTGGFALPSLSV
jgi:hypothetical protein